MTHICVNKLTIICSGNGLSSDWCQAIIWTNAGILLIGLLGTNFSAIVIEIHTFPWKEVHLKMWSGNGIILSIIFSCVFWRQSHRPPKWRWSSPDKYVQNRLLRSPASWLFTQPFIRTQIKKHQSSASLAFVWGIHRDRCIPRTKGQLRGKCFHLMTSSWRKHVRDVL